MHEGFFSASSLALVKPPVRLTPECGRCGLHRKCKSPKMNHSGRGQRRILIVGEAPGRDEDDQGAPFVGRSGDKLRRILLRCGIDMRRDCWLFNSLSCHPEGDWVRDEKMVEWCRPRVTEAIRTLDPLVIVPLGKRAVRSVLGPQWGEDTKGVVRWAGWRIPLREPNVWVCPSFHPAFVLRREEQDRGLSERFLESHLSEVAKINARPWMEIPNYGARVKRIFDDRNAAAAIRGFTGRGRPTAVDYETTRLKPDGEGARIVCCSLSDGETTIAYPWLGEAREATGELLDSGVRLIASNMKFEQRWTQREFGFRARGFDSGWDTMLMAHVLDSRHGITSIKFQAFVRLGQGDYDSHLSPYLASRRKGGNEDNRIREVAMDELLLYCGQDSLLEHAVAMQQCKELGVRL